MRLDHLLSKRASKGCFTVELSSIECTDAFALNTANTVLITKNFGGDALRGNTRSHSEHESEDRSGRWYYAGDGMGEQVAAGSEKKSLKRYDIQ